MADRETFLHDIRQNLKLDFMMQFSQNSENGKATAHPKVHYCHSSHPGWIEAVVADTLQGKLNITHQQALWHSRYWSSGGNCYIFLKTAECNRILVWPGKFALELCKDNGCLDVKPMLEVKAHQKGWLELYEIFNGGLSSNRRL